MVTQKNRLICFAREIRKLIFNYILLSEGLQYMYMLLHWHILCNYSRESERHSDTWTMSCCSLAHQWIKGGPWKILEILVRLLAHLELDLSPWYTISNARFLSNQSISKVLSCYVQRFRRRCFYNKVHYFTFDLDLKSRTNKKRCPVSSTSYDLCNYKVWSCYVKRLGGNAFTRNIWFDLDPRWRSHEALPSTSCTYVPAKFEVAASNG